MNQGGVWGAAPPSARGLLRGALILTVVCALAMAGDALRRVAPAWAAGPAPAACVSAVSTSASASTAFPTASASNALASATLGLAELSFVDRSHGWAAAGQLSGDGGQYFVVAETTDGGASWRVQRRTVAFNGTGVDLQFVSTTHGIWVNTWVFLSTDASVAWRRLPLLPRWGGASFVDFATEKVVWIAGTDGGAGGSCLVARSADGGRTWRTVMSRRTPLAVMPSGLSAPTASTAYIWCRGLWVTRDAGRAWTRVKADRVFKNAYWAIDFPSRLTGWLMRPDTGFLWRTRDGGRHWAAQMPGLRQRLQGMDFVSARTGWVVGAAGAVYRTQDGGQSWSFLQTPTHDTLGEVDFIDKRTGWVATAVQWGEPNAVYRTLDGGETWERMR
jgi:photosystem II stability/assembly factor-like uncharacterized protein